MNTGDLNEFFEQILHTERSLSCRNSKLRQLREEIQTCTQGVERVRQEVETLEGELAVRNVKMVDEEVEARLLCLRETILEQQNQQLLATNQTMASELQAEKLKLESEREEFLEELREFGRSYDLVGAGSKHREQLTQKKVSTLQDEVLLLEAELAEFECEREEVKKLEQNLVEVEQTLAKKQTDKKLLENQILEGEAEIRRLKEECESLGSKPSTDPEILKLQRELEECKDCPEEKMYHSLHKELEELQRLCYHKQMRQHVSRRKDQHGGVGSYNPYVCQYGGRGGVGEGGRGGGGMQGSAVRAGREGTGGEEGDGEEGDEGWDDELEAAELALLQESVGFSEMEWVDDEEKEDDDFEIRHGREVEGEKGSECGERQPPKTKHPPPTSLPTKSGCSGTNHERKVPLVTPQDQQQSTSSTRAVRTVVKGRERFWELANRRLAQVTDSPATVPVRRPSGTSIYKAPGQQESQPQNGVPKTAKRVRFRY